MTIKEKELLETKKANLILDYVDSDSLEEKKKISSELESIDKNINTDWSCLCHTI